MTHTHPYGKLSTRHPTLIRLVSIGCFLLEKSRTLSATSNTSSSTTHEARVSSAVRSAAGPTLESFVPVLDFGSYFLFPHLEIRDNLKTKHLCIQGLRMGEASRHNKYTTRSFCERDQGNAKWCGEKAMRECQFSVLVSVSNYRPSFIPGSLFLGRYNNVYYCCLFLPSTLKPKNQNRL